VPRWSVLRPPGLPPRQPPPRLPQQGPVLPSQAPPAWTARPPSRSGSAETLLARSCWRRCQWNWVSLLHRYATHSDIPEVVGLFHGLAALQVDELSGQKGFIHSDREIKAHCSQLIKDLRLRVSEHIKTSQTITDCLRRILTPMQVAKFLVWVERNQRSMDLLNTMFQSDEAI